MNDLLEQYEAMDADQKRAVCRYVDAPPVAVARYLRNGEELDDEQATRLTAALTIGEVVLDQSTGEYRLFVRSAPQVQPLGVIPPMYSKTRRFPIGQGVVGATVVPPKRSGKDLPSREELKLEAARKREREELRKRGKLEIMKPWKH